VRAVPLYERAGFRVEGEEFEAPGIGPHRRMSLLVG
jgi:predicted GNAT family N-acyltransferase